MLKRILKMLIGKQVEPLDKINWPNGLLAKALADYYIVNRNTEEAKEILETLKKYFDRWINQNKEKEENL